MSFDRGNAVKYIARAGFKGGPEKELEDIDKAIWYLKDDREQVAKKLEAAKAEADEREKPWTEGQWQDEKEASNTTGGSIQLDGSIDPAKLSDPTKGTNSVIINVHSTLSEEAIRKSAGAALKNGVSR